MMIPSHLGGQSLQADNTDNEDEDEDGENVSDAEGKAENHGQDSKPRWSWWLAVCSIRILCCDIFYNWECGVDNALGVVGDAISILGDFATRRLRSRRCRQCKGSSPLSVDTYAPLVKKVAAEGPGWEVS